MVNQETVVMLPMTSGKAYEPRQVETINNNSDNAKISNNENKQENIINNNNNCDKDSNTNMNESNNK